MELAKWLTILKNAKAGSLLTGGSIPVKVFANAEHTELTIRSDITTCHKCNTKCPEYVKVTFKEPKHNLTVFEAGLLYYLFSRNKKPIDYAGYHTCVAGKRFIENIKGVETYV